MRQRMGFAVALVGTCLVVAPLGCDEDETTPGPTGGSTTSSTTSSTASTSGTGTGGGSGGCQNDGHEPNDTPATATELPSLTDVDPTPLPEIDGVVAGSADTDWFVYDASDEVGLAVVDPERRFENPATALRLCAYFWCTDPAAWGPPAIGDPGTGGAGGSAGGGGSGPSVHVCPDGTEAVTEDLSSLEHGGESLGVAAGCCTLPGTTAIHLGGYFPTVHWPLDCPGALDPEDMLVLLRVEAYATQPPDACTPYTVIYHF